MRTGKVGSFLGANGLRLPHVSLVADQNFQCIRLRIVLHFTQPVLLHIFKALLIGDVIDEDNSMGICVRVGLLL